MGTGRILQGCSISVHCCSRVEPHRQASHRVDEASGTEVENQVGAHIHHTWGAETPNSDPIKEPEKTMDRFNGEVGIGL